MLEEGRPVGFLTVSLPDGQEGISIWKLKRGAVVDLDLLPSWQIVQAQMERRGVPAPGEPEEPEEPEPEEEEEPEPEEEEEPELPEPEEEEPEPEEEEEPEEVVMVSHLPTLMQGNSGPDVVNLQQALGITGKLGFFGGMTADKVRAFQRANGLKDDGIVGQETWAALLS
jgi:murein L,D-transpeptidase YcbB/YkuD